MDVLVTPAAPGPGPDPSTTGNPAFNSPWSLLGLPTVSFPIGFSADGLPLAVQLVGGADSDLDLLQNRRVVRIGHPRRQGSKTMTAKTEPQTADLNPNGQAPAPGAQETGPAVEQPGNAHGSEPGKTRPPDADAVDRARDSLESTPRGPQAHARGRAGHGRARSSSFAT